MGKKRKSRRKPRRKLSTMETQVETQTEPRTRKLPTAQHSMQQNNCKKIVNKTHEDT